MAGSWITVFRWSLFKPSSLLLILLWVFNPLGSQASFRGVYLKPTVNTSNGTITYMDPDLIGGLQSSYDSVFFTDRVAYYSLAQALYTTVCYDTITATQYVDQSSPALQDVVSSLGGSEFVGVQAAMDPWGNVRIPHLEYQDTFDANDPHAWISTPWSESVQNVQSLVGDVVHGINRTFTGNTTFNVTSSYQKFNVWHPSSEWSRLKWLV
jgi:hypothetical protein